MIGILYTRVNIVRSEAGGLTIFNSDASSNCIWDVEGTVVNIIGIASH